MDTAHVVAAGRDAIERGAWREAYEALNPVKNELSAEALSDLAFSAKWIGKPDEALAISETAYHAYAAAGDDMAAGREAIELLRAHDVLGHSSRAEAWYATARRHLKGAKNRPEEALVVYLDAVEDYSGQNWEDARGKLDLAIELAEKHRDSTMVVRARMLQGMVDIEAGNAEEGMRLFREAATSVGAGAVDPWTAGVVYCNIIETCWDMADLGGAAEWCDSAQSWYQQFDVSVFPGICTVRKAEVKALEGEWEAAELELQQAEEELKRYSVVGYLAELKYVLGDIQLHRGRTEEAIELFQQANELGREPLPGFALVSAARGDRSGAITTLRRALDAHGPRMKRSRVLVPLIDLLIEAGDLESAAESAAELEDLAAECNTGAMRAWADTAAGALLAAKGETEAALETFDAAERLWEKINIPYEAARTRVRRGLLRRSLGDDIGAEIDFRAAQGIFSRLGAEPELTRTLELMSKRPEAKTQHRAVMVTDIVGSTELANALGDDAWTKLLSWHDRTVSEIIERFHDGSIDRTGDGYLTAFSDTETAVRCAIEIQQALEAHRSEHGFAPSVRIGIHAADITDVDGSPAGASVHLAARIGALAEGDQILVTREAAAHLGAHRVSGWRLEVAKGFDDPVEVGALDW